MPPSPPLRLRALGPSRRLFAGIGSCQLRRPAGHQQCHRPRPLGAILHVVVPLASKFALTQKLSVSTSPFPDLVRDPPAAPPASTPTNVGFTILFFGGVAAIVLFLLNIGWFADASGQKSDILAGSFSSKNTKGNWGRYGLYGTLPEAFLVSGNSNM
jgi:hypothetical protein